MNWSFVLRCYVEYEGLSKRDKGFEKKLKNDDFAVFIKAYVRR